MAQIFRQVPIRWITSRQAITRFAVSISIIWFMLSSCSQSNPTSSVLPEDSKSVSPTVPIQPTTTKPASLTPVNTLPPTPKLITIQRTPLETPLPLALYFLAQDSAGKYQIFRLSPDGSILHQLTHAENDIRVFSVSQNGDLAYILLDQDGERTIDKLVVEPKDRSSRRTIDKRGDELEKITFVRWSPDGRKLVFARTVRVTQSDSKFGVYPSELVLFDFMESTSKILLSNVVGFQNPVTDIITSTESQLYTQNQFQSKNYSISRWTEDGRFLLISDGSFWVLYDLQAGEAKSLEVWGTEGEISQDGMQVFIGGMLTLPESDEKCALNASLTLIDLNTNDVKGLLNCPDWDPFALHLDRQTKSLIFLNQNDPGLSIVRYPLATKEQPTVIREEPLTNIQSGGIYSPDGNLLVISGESKIDNQSLSGFYVLPINTYQPVQFIPGEYQSISFKGVLFPQWGPAGKGEYIPPTSTPDPSKASPTPPSVCAGAPPITLKIGNRVMVSLDPPLYSRIRGAPRIDGEVLGQAKPGEIVTIMDGPQCADSFAWWKIMLESNGLIGWTAEGDSRNYWLVTPVP